MIKILYVPTAWMGTSAKLLLEKRVYIYTSRAFMSEFTVAENLSKLLCAVLFDFVLYLSDAQAGGKRLAQYLVLSSFVCDHLYVKQTCTIILSSNQFLEGIFTSFIAIICWI